MKTKFPGWRTMTGAQRRNAQSDAIFEYARSQGHITLGCQTEAWTQGAKAKYEGIEWWKNPYPSGSVVAYEWDQGHTAARKRA